MSLVSSIKNAAKSVLRSKLVSKAAPFLKAIPGVGTALTAASLVSAARGAVSAGSKAVRAIPGKGVIAGAATGAYLAYDANGNPITRRRRRMNYMNVKAAKRAGRRVKGAIKLLRNLEKSLPHRTVHRRAA